MAGQKRKSSGALGGLVCLGAMWLALTVPANSQVADLEEATLAEVAQAAGFLAGAAIESPESFGVSETVGLHFNSVTSENALKWGGLASSVGNYDFARADALVDFAEARRVRIRGHALVWSRGPLPSDLAAQVAAAADPAARLTEIIEQHVATVVGRYAGRIETWDVVNEPLDEFDGTLENDLFTATLGESYIDVTFAAARAADPAAHLVLNEFFGAYDGAKARGFLDLVQRLLARGVPIDGVGIQAHQTPQPLMEAPWHPAFGTFLADLAALGVTVELTEVDVSIFWYSDEPDPLAAQAETYGLLAADCLAVPACRGLTVWGVSDADTWLDTTFPWLVIAPNRPLLFDESLAPKPAYEAVRDAVSARLPLPIRVDIKPGACPNAFNRKGRGVLPVAVLGTSTFDVSRIDLSTLRLERADGVGGFASPYEGPPGPGSAITDVGTPFAATGCDCHEFEGDGLPDLWLAFRTSDVVAELQLDDLSAGGLAELVVRGNLLDRTPFAGSDCLRLVPPRAPPGQLHRTGS